MATFTTKLIDVIESGEPIWETAENGGRPYPIFDEAWRAELNQKIEDHYALREIGTETIGHFRFMLNRKMREIMPLYNQLYKSEKLVDPDDALTTVTLATDAQTHGTDEHASHTTGATTQNDANTSHSTTQNDSQTDNTSRAVSSDTPQTRLAGDEDYATGVSDVTGRTNVTGAGSSDATSTGETSGTSTGDATQTGQTTGTMTNTVKGSQGHTAVLLAQYRASFLNIDMMVIRELETLFMQVWDNGDEFFNHRIGMGGYGYGFRTYGGFAGF